MKKQKSDLLSLVTFSNIKSQGNIVSKNYKNKKNLNKYFLSYNSNIYDIALRLREKKFYFSVPNIVLIRENKYRIIMAQCIDDKIVSHFLTNFFFKPYLEKKLIIHSVSTRVGLGNKAAYKYFLKYLNTFDLNKKVYVLKIDISKYFYSISHEKLKSMLENCIEDDFALSLFFDLLDVTNDPKVNKKIDNLIEVEKNRIKKLKLDSKLEESIFLELDKVPRYKTNYGIGIGDCVSQFIALLYTTKIDRYIKETLKCKYYVKYTDDYVILHEDKEFLKKCFKDISNLINDLDLQVNPKSGIFEVNNGFTFLGNTYGIRNGKVFIKAKNQTFRKVLRKLKKLREKDFNAYYLSKISYRGFINKKYLFSLKEDCEFLKNKFKVPVLVVYDLIYEFDKSEESYISYLKKNSKLSYLEYLKKNKKPFIYITETKVEFYNYSLS